MGNFDYLIDHKEYKNIYESCNGAELEGDGNQRAILCRKSLQRIIELIYSKQGIQLPEMATMLELINGDIITSFLESSKLIEAAHFIRKVGANAEHGTKVKKTHIKLAFDELVFLAVVNFLCVKLSSKTKTQKKGR